MSGFETPQPLCQCLNTEELLFILKMSWVEGSNEKLLKDLVTSVMSSSTFVRGVVSEC